MAAHLIFVWSDKCHDIYTWNAVYEILLRFQQQYLIQIFAWRYLLHQMISFCANTPLDYLLNPNLGPTFIGPNDLSNNWHFVILDISRSKR